VNTPAPSSFQDLIIFGIRRELVVLQDLQETMDQFLQLPSHDIPYLCFYRLTILGLLCGIALLFASAGRFLAAVLKKKSFLWAAMSSLSSLFCLLILCDEKFFAYQYLLFFLDLCLFAYFLFGETCMHFAMKLSKMLCS